MRYATKISNEVGLNLIPSGTPRIRSSWYIKRGLGTTSYVLATPAVDYTNYETDTSDKSVYTPVSPAERSPHAATTGCKMTLFSLQKSTISCEVNFSAVSIRKLRGAQPVVIMYCFSSLTGVPMPRVV